MKALSSILACLLVCFGLIKGQTREQLEELQQAEDVRRQLQAFNIDRDNYFDAVTTAIPNIVRSGLSKFTGDVTLVIRFATLLNVARFDANAPYTATTVGITTQLPRRPYNEWTLRNKNLACLYAGYRVLLSVIPQETELIRQMMYDLGLNPDDNREDEASPVGIGNLCGNNVVHDRINDGVNQLGDEGGRRYNREPYADYTGYEPVNTALKLIDPSRWQPYVEATGKGKFKVQHFVTPHNGLVRPYTYEDVNQFEVGPHGRILKTQYDLAKYKESTDEVIRVSASLTEEQKLKSEFYEDKVRSVLGSINHIVRTRGYGIDEFNQLELISNMAVFDTMIVVWKEKKRWDAVRPFSAIKYLYGDQPLTAWGGPYNGTVYDIPASEWRHYLPVADHPEYPSASTGACVSHAEAMKLWLGSDELNWPVTFEQGSSRIEPGYSPVRNFTVLLPTFSHFGEECGQSRLWGGVHFQDAIDNIKGIAKTIAGLTVDLVRRHVYAEAPAPQQQQQQHAEPQQLAVQVQQLPVHAPYQLSAYPASVYPAVTPAPRFPHLGPLRAHSPRSAKNLFQNHFSYSVGF